MDTTPLILLLVVAAILWPTALVVVWHEMKNGPLMDGEYSRLDRMDGRH